MLQIGDSHSAGDNISGAWRDMLQARFGGGGRGVLPPGKPFVGFLARGIIVDQSAGWTSQSIFDPAFRDYGQHALFGISGYRLTNSQPGASLTLNADTPAFSFNRMVVPGGSNGARLPGAAGRCRAGGAGWPAAGRLRQLPVLRPRPWLSHGDAGTVTISSWASFGDIGGVAVSTLAWWGRSCGTSAGPTTWRWPRIWAYQPGPDRAGHGTNDGFVDIGCVVLRAALRAQIARVQRLSGGAPILVLGAPDAETNRSDLVANDLAGVSSEPIPGTWFPPPALGEVRVVAAPLVLSAAAAWACAGAWAGRRRPTVGSIPTRR